MMYCLYLNIQFKHKMRHTYLVSCECSENKSVVFTKLKKKI